MAAAGRDRVHPFDRCGLASLDDLETAEYKTLFAELEAAQADFRSLEDRFRSPGYPWPRDALHWWSRCWEYPYVLYHLRNTRSPERSSADALARILDVGSGVTFFPFVVARDGWNVLCLDADPAAQHDLERAGEIVAAAPGVVRSMTADAAALPIAAASMDAAYCISVLEHLDEPQAMVMEVARVLKPGALFVATFDVATSGAAQVDPQSFAALLCSLRSLFTWAAPETTIHPLRVLESANAPFPLDGPCQVPGLLWRSRSGKLSPLLGGPSATSPRLACCGFALRRSP